MVTRGKNGNNVTAFLPHNQGILFNVTIITNYIFIHYYVKNGCAIFRYKNTYKNTFVYRGCVSLSKNGKNGNIGNLVFISICYPQPKG